MLGSEIRCLRCSGCRTTFISSEKMLLKLASVVILLAMDQSCFTRWLREELLELLCLPMSVERKIPVRVDPLVFCYAQP